MRTLTRDSSVLPDDLQVPEQLSRRKVRKQLLFLTGVVLTGARRALAHTSTRPWHAAPRRPESRARSADAEAVSTPGRKEREVVPFVVEVRGGGWCDGYTLTGMRVSSLLGV